MKQRFIVLSADALVTEDLEYLKTLPNYRKYLEGGAGVTKMRSVYPTVTYPAHNSISTGTYPHKHGICSNIQLFSNDWKWFSEERKIEDIYTAAKRNGRTTASVFWPVTGNHPSVDYLIDEYWAQGDGDTPRAAFERSGSSEIVLSQVIDKYLPYHKDRIHPYCDYFVANCGAEIIRRFQPDIIMLHPGNVDAYRHGKGLFNEQVTVGIKETDDFIGILAEAAEQAGVMDETNFVLISDHGQLEIKRIVNINVLLQENGFIKLDENGKIVSWRAYARSGGMSSLIYLHDLNDKALYDEVYALLKKYRDEEVYGFGEIMTSAETDAKYKLNGDFSFVVETDGYTSFGDKCTRPLVGKFDLSDYRFGRATHGYKPEKGPQPIFRAKGPGFADGAEIPSACLVDIAPTIAEIMGFALPEAEGKPMSELIQKK